MAFKTVDEKNTYYRERYRKLRKEGLCGQCGRFKTRLCMCLFCREAHNINRKRRGKRYHHEDGKARYQRARERGLCVTCGVPSLKFTRCKSCREIANEARRGKRVSWTSRYDRLYRESRRLACEQKDELVGQPRTEVKA